MAGEDPILIVGGGVAGLTAALALRRFGREVVLFEQAKALAELGAGLQISANGARVLIELGLEPALREVVADTEGKVIRLWSTGQTWKLFDLGPQSVERYGAPYWMVHRGDLHRVLLEAAEAAGVVIRAGARASGYRQDGARVWLELADGGTVAGSALIGADGIHSAVRGRMIGADRAEFTGIMAWRGIARADDLPAHLSAPIGTNWVGPGRHVVSYPLRRGDLINFVGVVESDAWRGESWHDQGEVAEVTRDFEGWHEDVHTLIQALDQPFRWALLKRAPLERCAEGAVLLIGDACHPTLPFLAQGANMAIEDAIIAARCLDAFERASDAFAAFGELRLERTSRIVRGSADQASRFHNPALATRNGAAAYVEREWAPERVTERYDWLFKYDAVRVPLPGGGG